MSLAEITPQHYHHSNRAWTELGLSKIAQIEKFEEIKGISEYPKARQLYEIDKYNKLNQEVNKLIPIINQEISRWQQLTDNQLPTFSSPEQLTEQGMKKAGTVLIISPIQHPDQIYCIFDPSKNGFTPPAETAKTYEMYNPGLALIGALIGEYSGSPTDLQNLYINPHEFIIRGQYGPNLEANYIKIFTQNNSLSGTPSSMEEPLTTGTFYDYTQLTNGMYGNLRPEFKSSLNQISQILTPQPNINNLQPLFTSQFISTITEEQLNILEQFRVIYPDLVAKSINAL
jgi:hypothetical protein